MPIRTALSGLIVAYIDPGSGSMIFQAAIAAAMAVGLSVKLFWRRITAPFRKDPAREHEELSNNSGSR